MSDFNALGGMPSGPATFPDFRDLMAFVTSALVGGFVLISRSSVGGGMSGRTDGAGLLSVSWKCSAHLARCSSSPEMIFLFLSFTGRLGLFFFPECSGNFIQSLHVSLASCSFCLSSQLLFADSTALYLTLNDINDSRTIQNDLGHQQIWKVDWDMEFNPSKCQVIQVSRARHPIPSRYLLHGHILEVVDHA